MNRLQRSCLIAGLFVEILLNPLSSQAQFSADYQTNIISGVISNWSGQYIVGGIPGYTPASDVLLIQNGGTFTISGSSGYGFVLASTNNTVLVTDPGSALNVFNNFFGIGFGGGGIGNSVIISNSGKLVTSNFMLQMVVDGSPETSLLVTGPGSVFSNGVPLSVGSTGAGNSLMIRHGGLLVNNESPGSMLYAGRMPGSSNNTILVSDAGSVWTNSASAFVAIGLQGNNNALVISNGANVFGHNVAVGFQAPANGNSMQVAGHGSVCSNSGNVIIGDSGSNNSLVITNGGQVFDSDIDGMVEPSGVVGWQLGSNSNYVQVVDDGLWHNATVVIGSQGSSNSLTIDGGSVIATSLTIGLGSPTCDNLVQLNSGSLTVTNNGTGVLDVRDGELVVNGGILQVDTLVITNPCASFVHTGGTLVVGNTILDPNTFHITSTTRQGNDLLVSWLMGPGQSNTLQVTTGNPDGSYSTNNFTDIFIVTNNPTVGTATNYLDIGAATNFPSRFYRARLVP